MANTRVQVEVEDWVRREWLKEKYGQTFHRERVRLSSGEVFDFDAVSADGTIAASISTSSATTASGKQAVGKQQKLRADMLFLLLAEVKRRLLVLTEPDMYEFWMKERKGDRVPTQVEFVLANIPAELALRLRTAKADASAEVSPRRHTTT